MTIAEKKAELTAKYGDDLTASIIRDLYPLSFNRPLYCAAVAGYRAAGAIEEIDAAADFLAGVEVDADFTGARISSTILNRNNRNTILLNNNVLQIL